METAESCGGYSDLNIAFLNVEGLSRSRLSTPEIRELFSNYLIIGFAEIWCSSSGLSNLEVDGWKLFAKIKERRGKKGRHPGGLAVYVRNDLLSYTRERHSTCEDIILLEFEKDMKRLGIGFVYRPPTNSPYNNADFWDEMEMEVACIKEDGVEDVIVLGDFNARTGEAEDWLVGEEDTERNSNPSPEVDLLPDFYAYSSPPPARCNMDKETNSEGRRMCDLLKTTGMWFLNGRKRGDHTGELTYMVKRKTGLATSTIDYGIVTHSLYPSVDRFEVLDQCIDSSHFPISAEINLPLGFAEAVESEVTGEEITVKRIPKYKWNDANRETFMKYFLTIFHGIFLLCSSALRQNKIERAVYNFTHLMQHAAYFIRVRQRQKFKSRQLPEWWDDTCEVAKRAWQYALGSYRKFKSKIWRETLNDKKKEYRTAKKKAMKNLKEKKREELMALKLCNDTKGVWKIIKRFTRAAHNTGKQLVSSQKWLAHFSDVLNPAVVHMRDEWKIPDTIAQDDLILDAPVSSQEVAKSLYNLKNSKAPGIDSIIPEMLKVTSVHTTALLANLFSKILELGMYPATWAKSIIIPLFKGKGSFHIPANYRGISLLPCVSKVFTRILNSRLTSWLNSKNVIVEEQAGFRQHYSTIDNCFILETLIESRLRKKGQKLYACFIDFRKAFDFVPRSALWYKLYKIGIQGKFLRLLISMYSKCKFSIRIGESSLSPEEGETTAGVFQGCVLSPTLFQVFINDLTAYCSIQNPELAPDRRSKYIGPVDAPLLLETPVSTLLFADDVSLFSCSVEGLQRMINRVAEYASYWGLEVNVDKTNCMVFRRGGKVAKSERWNLNGTNINIVSRFKYLGIWFTACHGWSFHSKTVIERSMKVELLLRRLIYAVGDLPLKFWWHIFDTAVAPISLYGSEIWGCKVTPAIDRVDYKFAKMILRLPEGTTSSGLMLMLDRSFTSYWKAKHRMLQYWAKTITLPETRLVKKAYREQINLSQEGIDCWASRVKNILSEQNMKEYWDLQRIPSKKAFSILSKSHLVEQARAECIAEAYTKPSLERFLTHHGHNVEQNEVLNLPPDIRRLVLAAKLNLPSFIDFATVDGARVKLCQVCKAQTENYWCHLIWDCPPLRAAFYNLKIYEHLPQRHNLSKLYQPLTMDCPRVLGNFFLECEKIIKARKRDFHVIPSLQTTN